jgi:hypothetical protein
MLQAAADGPHVSSSARAKAAQHNSSPPPFKNDAERYAWVILQAPCGIASRRFLSKPVAYRNLAAEAFGVTVEDLLLEARAVDLVTPRQKIMCFVRLVTGARWHALARLFKRTHSTIIHAYRKYAREIAPLCGNAVVAPARKYRGALK